MCFNNAHDLSAAVISTMAQLMQTVTTALRARSSSCVLISGEKVSQLLLRIYGYCDIVSTLKNSYRYLCQMDLVSF